MNGRAQGFWQTCGVLAVCIALACVPLVSMRLWAGVPSGAPVLYSAPDVATVPTMAANKLRLTDVTGTTGPVLCAMDFTEGPPTELPGCDIVLIRLTTDCNTAGTNDVWCRWNGTTYVPSGGDVATFARVDGDGELISPETVTGSFLLRGAGPPAAGSCPHNKAFYSDTTGLGDTYVCYGSGQNWHLIGANDDNFIELTLDDQSPLVASGPSFGVLRSRLRIHATDCTALTDGVSGQACWEQDSNRIFVCEPTAGGCDTAGEWILSTGSASVSMLPFGAVSGGGFTCSNPGPTNRYFTIGSTPGTSDAARAMRVATGFTAIAIAAHTDAVLPGSQTAIVTLRDDAVDTAVTCTIGSGAADCQGTGFSVAVAANSNIAIEVACGGGTTALDSFFVSVTIQ